MVHSGAWNQKTPFYTDEKNQVVVRWTKGINIHVCVCVNTCLPHLGLEGEGCSHLFHPTLPNKTNSNSHSKNNTPFITFLHKSEEK